MIKFEIHSLSVEDTSSYNYISFIRYKEINFLHIHLIRL